MLVGVFFTFGQSQASHFPVSSLCAKVSYPAAGDSLTFEGRIKVVPRWSSYSVPESEYDYFPKILEENIKHVCIQYAVCMFYVESVCSCSYCM